jgi:RNA polymerase sigma-70 factor, ECF subfamily
VRHEFQGEPLQEVALALGLSLTATKSRVRRARLMLREMLDQCCRFEFDRRGRVIEATPRGECEC